MTWLRATFAKLRGALAAQPPLFLATFLALGIYTWFIHFKFPLGPGQDYHFHLMVASVNGRSLGDPVRRLYEAVDPFTANTLLYMLAWPFEKVFAPVRAFQLTVTLFYFLGFPLACAVAAVRTGRSPWGALLAFPLAYHKDWSQNGFMPFLSAAPFYVLAIAELHVAHGSVGRRRRNAAIGCAFACVFTFLGHGHVFVWLALLLAMLTVVAMLRPLSGFWFGPRAALAGAVRTGLLSLAIITPALAFFGRWYWVTHYGPHAVKAVTQTAVDVPWATYARLEALPHLLSAATGPTDAAHLVLLGLVVMLCWFVARRPAFSTRAVPSFELCFLASLLSYFVLPYSFGGGQTVAVRHMSLTLWLLPLVVLAEVPKRLRLGERAAIAALALFTVVRLDFFGTQLAKLNREEYAGLLPLARKCRTLVPPGTTAELAYAAVGRDSAYWRDARALHQAHETFAAVCGLDTPVYDSRRYPNNFVPLRYRDGLPAPITIFSGDAGWYRSASLWDGFEFVLVQGWTVSPATAAELLPRAELVASSGAFQLWRRKPAPAAE